MRWSTSSIENNPLENEFFFTMCKVLGIIIILGLVAFLIWYFFLRKKSNTSGTTTSGTTTKGTTTSGSTTKGTTTSGTTTSGTTTKGTTTKGTTTK